MIKQASFNYSLKNIPTPSNNSHLRGVIVKCEHFLQRLRWKVIHFLQDKENSDTQPEQNNYGFKTPKNAPQPKALINFENDLSNLVASLEYTSNPTTFQKQLKKDVNHINNSKNIFVQADKTSNIYEVEPEMYKKLMRDNITANYSKADENFERDINVEAKKLTEKLSISNRVEKIAHKNAYITVKDHKPDFPNTIKCRLINPTKSNIGKISKQMLEDINKQLLSKLKLRQLKNSQAAVDWFNNLENKTRLQFMQIDIVDYYPSITHELFNKAIDFAKAHVNIDNLTIEIILNARKSILSHENSTWTKTSSNFDIAMGAYDGAEMTDLVGIYILHRLSQVVPEIEFGLYRDDGLGVHKRIPKTQLEQIKKKIFKLFKDMGLSITLESYLTRVDFLDITFNLHQETFEPYRKPNDNPNYIHIQSNHPKPTIKNLPTAVNKRLSEISCNKEVFDKHKGDYETALRNSELPHNLSYREGRGRVNRETQEQTHRNTRNNDPTIGRPSPPDHPTTGRKKRNRNRKVTWFNPPFNIDLKTNIGREFLKLIDKNFPKDNPLSKIINRKTIKVSYSCTANMSAIISAHNQKILKETSETHATPPCNCRNQCILPNNCRASCIVYKASTDRIEYIGSTSTEFKVRYRNHKSSFKHSEKKNQTALSSYIWNNSINRNDIGEIIEPNVKWQIMKKCTVYSAGKKTRDLCTTEKLLIIKNLNNTKNINHRSDIGNKCSHRNRDMLSAIT